MIQSESSNRKYGYLSGYSQNRFNSKSTRVRVGTIIEDFEDQIKLLDKLFNSGDRYNPDWIVRAHAKAPDIVEKFFASFNWRHISNDYIEATAEVLLKLQEARNMKFNKLSLQCLSGLYQTEKSKSGMEQLFISQKRPEIIAIAGQLGAHRTNITVDRLITQLSDKEYPLGVFNNGLILLNNPNRLEKEKDLFLQCAGDRVPPRIKDSEYCYSLEFSMELKKVLNLLMMIMTMVVPCRYIHFVLKKEKCSLRSRQCTCLFRQSRFGGLRACVTPFFIFEN